jgi:hypothetical protein
LHEVATILQDVAWECDPVREEGREVDKELFSEQVQVERKLFTFELRENPRGRFLRVTEDVGGRRDTIIIPAVSLDAVAEVIGRASMASNAAGAPEADDS